MGLRALKDRVRALVPLPAPVLLALAGLACFLVTCAVFRKPLSWGWGLLPGVALGLVIEALEVKDQYAAGLQDTGVPGIVARHLTDVAVMNLPAALIVLVSAQLA
jgi:hypothetical protein